MVPRQEIFGQARSGDGDLRCVVLCSWPLESINIEFEEFLDEDQARGYFAGSARHHGHSISAKTVDIYPPFECVGDYATFISRNRQDSTIGQWAEPLVRVPTTCVKAAALNASKSPKRLACAA